MSTPITWAQDVITCGICNNAAYQFCNSCQIKLCENCINKHVNAHKLLPHDIVPLLNRNEKEVSQKCELHPGQRCEACCQQCDVLVCMKCVITSHKGHIIDEIPSDYHGNIKKIMLETEELQKKLDLQRQQNEAQEWSISKTREKFEDLERELEEPRKCWHHEVEEIFDKHQDLIKSMKDKAIKSLTEQNLAPNKMAKRMLQTIKENTEILESKAVSKVVKYKSKLQEYNDIPADIEVNIPCLKINTDPGKKLSLEFGEYRALLTQTLPFNLTNDASGSSSTKSFGQGITEIQTPLNDIDAIACIGSDEAWLARQNRVIRLDMHGSVKESFYITKFPVDLSVTPQGELIYTDLDNVTIVRFGKKETLIKAHQSWMPLGLCCTNSGDILVSMMTENGRYMPYKIVRYRGEKVEQEIEKDSDGNPIYLGGNFFLYIAENRNRDICASDGNAKKVVVVNENGKVRFWYRGYPARKKKYFCPEQIATDFLGQIIVTDHNNDCLHILDQDGQFLRIVDNCGLDTPVGLSVDNKGRCWVGSYSGKLKVISLKM